MPVTRQNAARLGRNSLNAPELARRAEAEGVAMLTVHGRTRCQFYRQGRLGGDPRRSSEACRIPVVANGDCASLADADDDAGPPAPMR